MFESNLGRIKEENQMEPMKLYFDVRDILRAPRLALSGKKIWVMLSANIPGYVLYWLLTYLSLAIAGVSFGDAWDKYGLYPCVVGNDPNWAAYLVWIIGILAWLAAMVLGSVAVARITYKQLKGDEFYSSSDAWKFVKKHWHAPVFTHISILIIALFFVVMAAIFALIGKIPYFGELFFGIPYLLWFFGSVFVVYTVVVLVVSVFFTHAIVSTLEEDTMGAVFQNYSITWSQPWRIVLYLPLIGALIYAGFMVFGWFITVGYQLINIVFGHRWLMGDKLSEMVDWATNIVLAPSSPVAWILGLYSGPWWYFDVPEATVSLGVVEYVGGFFICVSLFLLVATLISYALTTQVVGETIAVVIFKKKTDDENLLQRKDEEELEAEEEETDLSTEEPQSTYEEEATESSESSNEEEEGPETQRGE